MSQSLVQGAQTLLSIYSRVDWDQIDKLPNDDVCISFQSDEAVQTANHIWLELAATQPEQREYLLRKIKNAFKNIGQSLKKMGFAGQPDNRVDILLVDLGATQDPCHFAELCLETARLHEAACTEVRNQLRQKSVGVKKLLPPPPSVSPFWLGSAADRWMCVPLRLALAEPIIGLCRRITAVNTGATTLHLEPGEEFSIRQFHRLFNECDPKSFRVAVDESPHQYQRELQKLLDAFVPELRRLTDLCLHQFQIDEMNAVTEDSSKSNTADMKPRRKSATKLVQININGNKVVSVDGKVVRPTCPAFALLALAALADPTKNQVDIDTNEFVSLSHRGDGVVAKRWHRDKKCLEAQGIEVEEKSHGNWGLGGFKITLDPNITNQLIKDYLLSKPPRVRRNKSANR